VVEKKGGGKVGSVIGWLDRKALAVILRAPNDSFWEAKKKLGNRKDHGGLGSIWQLEEEELSPS